MKKLLLLLFLLPIYAQGQWFGTIWGIAQDSTTFTFLSGDTLTRVIPTDTWGDTAKIVVDTSGSTLWQIGGTTKTGFTTAMGTTRGIMTDTLNAYPSNTNSFFVVKIGSMPNVIVDFWHHYNTDSAHAGGAVEFSTDSGATWINVASCPNIDTFNFYTAADTISNGVAAFHGTNSFNMLSRVQFIDCIGVKTTSTSCFPNFTGPQGIYLRFRFISDTAVNTTDAGWLIDSIKIENPGCIPGFVPQLHKIGKIDVFPDPATDIVNISCSSQIGRVIITDVLGKERCNQLCNNSEIQIDISTLPKGIYFVRVAGMEVRKLVKE